jgi:hypothetical protein
MVTTLFVGEPTENGLVAIGRRVNLQADHDVDAPEVSGSRGGDPLGSIGSATGHAFHRLSWAVGFGRGYVRGCGSR